MYGRFYHKQSRIYSLAKSGTHSKLVRIRTAKQLRLRLVKKLEISARTSSMLPGFL